VRQVQEIGCAMGGQTERMVPADKRLYALRDVTATVPSIPLIVASILSKKLAENLDALVLDVKFGAAAFMRTAEQARELAQAMVSLGRQCGVNTRALLTSMDTPLGRAAGNWLEIRESVACLEGHGPSDLEQLVLECTAHLLVQTGREADLVQARSQARICLASGQPRRKWDEMLAAQGADLRAFERKLALDHTAPGMVEVKADRGGFVNHCDARIIGELVRDLGGGRLTKETIIHPEVGVDRLAKPGEPVQVGALLGRLHAADQAQAEAAASRLRAAFTIADERPKPAALIVQMIV